MDAEAEAQRQEQISAVQEEVAQILARLAIRLARKEREEAESGPPADESSNPLVGFAF
jgi:hypothetical protein